MKKLLRSLLVDHFKSLLLSIILFTVQKETSKHERKHRPTSPFTMHQKHILLPFQ